MPTSGSVTQSVRVALDCKVVVLAFPSHMRIGGGEIFVESIPTCAFFFKWRSAGAHQFLSLSQDQSTVAQRAEATVAERSLTSCM